MKLDKFISLIGIALVCLVAFAATGNAAQDVMPRPVRISILAVTHSGVEQQLVDALTAELRENPNIVLSTVNPDWFVNCRIEDHTDFASMNVRVNGTVTVETAKDGAVLNTFSAQANKQDFAVSGTAPVNKALITSAMNEVVHDLTQRSVQPIEDAAFTEIDAREKILKAKALESEDKYEDALSTVMQITRDSPHFWPAHALVDHIKMEKEAYELVGQAKSLARQGQYRQAIADLRQVSSKSKRYRTAQGMIATYSQQTLAKNKSKVSSGLQAEQNSQLKALQAEKRELEARRRAIEAQEAAIKSAH